MIKDRLSKMLTEDEETHENKDLTSKIMEYEEGELSTKDTLELFSELIKTGMAWKLQGHYGRTAKALIDRGYLDKDGKIMKEEETMVEAKNTDVIDLFMTDSFPKNKKTNWGTEHLKINKEENGWSVINYATPILYRDDKSGDVFLNKQKYSVTTSKIQNQMRYLASKHNVDLKEVNEKEIKEAMEAKEPFFKN